MRYTLVLAGLIATLLLLTLSVTASCAMPSISLNSQTVAAGGSITVTGQYFMDGCHDLIENGHREPTLPEKNIRILLVQGKHSKKIGNTDAGKDFNISLTVTIPANTPPGNASIVAEGSTKSWPAHITINAKESAPPKASGTK